MCVGPSPEMQLLMRLREEGYFVPLLTFYTALMRLIEVCGFVRNAIPVNAL